MRNAPGDLHMEYGEPEGSVLFFSMQADDGTLFEFLDRNGKVLRLVTVHNLSACTTRSRGSSAHAGGPVPPSPRFYFDYPNHARIPLKPRMFINYLRARLD